jgi:hypothetical protein
MLLSVLFTHFMKVISEFNLVDKKKTHDGLKMEDGICLRMTGKTRMNIAVGSRP